jgi:hypothetical protein
MTPKGLGLSKPMPSVSFYLVQCATLNALFREWLHELGTRNARREKISKLMEDMKQYDLGGPYTRDEMNAG